MQLQEAAPDAPLTWDSKVDKFDKRLTLFRKQIASQRAGRGNGPDVVVEAELQSMSLFEFNFKYYYGKGNRLFRTGGVCLMVTPSFSADSSVWRFPAAFVVLDLFLVDFKIVLIFLRTCSWYFYVSESVLVR